MLQGLRAFCQAAVRLWALLAEAARVEVKMLPVAGRNILLSCVYRTKLHTLNVLFDGSERIHSPWSCVGYEET